MVTQKEAEEYYGVQSKKRYKRILGTIFMLLLLFMIALIVLDKFGKLEGLVLMDYKVVPIIITILSGLCFLHLTDMLKEISREIELLVSPSSLNQLKRREEDDNKLFTLARKGLILLKLKENLTIDELIDLLRYSQKEESKKIVDSIKGSNGEVPFNIYYKISEKNVYQSWMFKKITHSLIASELKGIDEKLRKEGVLVRECFRKSYSLMPITQLLKLYLEMNNNNQELIEEIIRRVDSNEVTLSKMSQYIIIYYPNDEKWKRVQQFVKKAFMKRLPSEYSRTVDELLKMLPQGSILRGLVLVRKEELD